MACSRLHSTISYLYLRMPSKDRFVVTTTSSGSLLGERLVPSGGTPVSRWILFCFPMLFKNLIPRIQKPLVLPLLNYHIRESKYKRGEQWEMEKKTWRGERKMRLRDEKWWGQGRKEILKGNRKRKRKLEKGELNRMKVRNRSEIEMRTGKALAKAKGTNVGCKANGGINREGLATDPDTLEISVSSEYANQDNGTII